MANRNRNTIELKKKDESDATQKMTWQTKGSKKGKPKWKFIERNNVTETDLCVGWDACAIGDRGQCRKNTPK